MRPLLFALLLGACSSHFESRTVEQQLEEDGGQISQQEAGEEDGAGNDSGTADTRPPDPCHSADGSVALGQPCTQTNHSMGNSCWIAPGECGCRVLVGPCLDSL